MFIVKVSNIIFKGNDSHTVGYRNKAIEYLTGDRNAQVGYDVVKKMEDGTVKWVAAETFEDAIKKMSIQLKNDIGRVSWLKADLDDFYFTACCEEIAADGQFWPPSSTNPKGRYRVSDGQKWS